MFKVGDAVEKSGGDYTFIGIVVAAFTKLSGVERYVVEDDRGTLHIFSDRNLLPRGHTCHAVGGNCNSQCLKEIQNESTSTSPRSAS